MNVKTELRNDEIASFLAMMTIVKMAKTLAPIVTVTPQQEMDKLWSEE